MEEGLCLCYTQPIGRKGAMTGIVAFWSSRRVQTTLLKQGNQMTVNSILNPA